MSGAHRLGSDPVATDDRVRPRSVLGRLGRAALTVAAGLGALSFVIMAVCAVLDVRPLVFLSGSMHPAIDEGALAFAQKTPAAELKRGDIVSVPTDNGSRITHRIVAIDRTGVTPALRLKGDANPVEDEKPYVVSSADRVIFSVPYVGRGLAFISSDHGLFLLGAGVTALLVFAFRPGVRRGSAGVATLVALPLALSLAASNAAQPTWAYFTDVGAITSVAATLNVQPPADADCSDAGLSATVSWPGDARYDYEVQLVRVSSGAVVSTRQVTGGTTQTTYTGLADFGLGFVLLPVDFRVEIRSYLTSSPTWRATSTRNYQNIRVNFFGLSVNCTS